MEINPQQHCTAWNCPYTTSHTASWCGITQLKRCSCTYCTEAFYATKEVIVSSDKERQVRERIEKTITDMLGTVLQPIIVTALTDKLMEVVTDYASDEYQRGYSDGQFNESYYNNTR